MSAEPELRFDAAPDPLSAATTCGRCSGSIAQTYFEANGAIVCPSCKAALEAEATGGRSSGRLARAAVYGFGAAVAGAALYYAILALTGYEIGLVAIAVGWLVGRAVQVGSRARGGWAYQGLAVSLTYLAIVSTYVPFILEGFKETPAAVAEAPAAADAPAAPAARDSIAIQATASAGPGSVVLGVVLLLALAVAAPFLAGLENVIGILIIGFALYQAWKMNARTTLVFTGPYALGAAAPAADA